MKTWFRVFFVGGAISFRALFAWIRPWVYIPTLVVGPTTQILFFAFLGRTAHLENDAWFVVGNAVQSASLAALFGMGFAIDALADRDLARKNYTGRPSRHVQSIDMVKAKQREVPRKKP